MSRSWLAILPLLLATAARPATGAPAFEVDDVPMVIVTGDQVEGRVSVLLSSTTTDTKDVAFKTTDMHHAWSQASDGDTETNTFRDDATTTVSKDFSEKLGGKNWIEASAGIGVSSNDKTVSSYQDVQTRKRDEEEKRDLSTQLHDFNRTVTTYKLSEKPYSGYARTGLHVSNYTSYQLTITNISDELQAVNAATGRPVDRSFDAHNPVYFHNTVAQLGPVESTSAVHDTSAVLSFRIPAQLPGGPGLRGMPLYYPDLNSAAVVSYFQRQLVFRDAITDFDIAWKGSTLSKSDIDTAIASAKQRDIVVRVIGKGNGDRITFLKPLATGTEATLLGAFQAAGHRIDVAISNQAVVAVDGVANNLPANVPADTSADHLSEGTWTVFRVDGTGYSPLTPGIKLSEVAVGPGDSYALVFVTLRDVLETQRILSRASFSIAHGATNAAMVAMPVWTGSASDFPLDLPTTDRKCLFATEQNPLRAGDTISIKLRSAKRDLSSVAVPVPGTWFVQTYHLPPQAAGFYDANKTTTYQLLGDSQTVGDVASPDDVGMTLSFGPSSPLLLLSAVVNDVSGSFNQSGDGLKVLSFTVTDELLGASKGPLCLGFPLKSTASLKRGNDFTIPHIQGRGQTAIPPPPQILNPLVTWKASDPVVDAPLTVPQVWAVEVTRSTAPWK